MDLDALADLAAEGGCPAELSAAIGQASTAADAFAAVRNAGFPLADMVALRAWRHAAAMLAATGTTLEVAIFDREGVLRGHAPFASVDAPHPLYLRR